MALPLKSGADFYTQEIRRVALQNEGSDLPEYLSGSIYFNTNSESNTSDRIRYRGRNAWHSVANLEDIARLEGLIADLGDVSGGNITDLLNRIKAIEDDYLTDADKNELSALITTLQGYFTNGVANDAAKLGGQLPSYYATASGLSALQEKVSAFLDGEADSDAVLENLKEIQAFLDSYDGATSLADMFAAVNTQIADRYTKGEVDTKLSAYRLLTNGTFDVLVDAKNGIETDEITIGGIKLSVVEGQLQIDGGVFATGQLASGGIGEAGSGSGASGIVILEDWSKYDDTVAQVVGAVLGKDLHDRLGVAESTIESLVGKATNVSVVQTLTSGKEIGAITIDGVATKLYAPATYAWGEITSKPTTLAGYGITDGVRYQNGIILADIPYNVVGYGYNAHGWKANGPAMSIGMSEGYLMQIQSSNLDGSLYHRHVNAGTPFDWHKLLDDANYASVLDTRYLQLTGGMLSKNAETLRLHSPEETNGSTFIKFTTSSKDTIQGYIGYSSSGFMFIQRGEGGLSGTQVVGLDNNGLFAWKDNAAKYFINEGNFNYYGTTIASGTWNIGINGRAAGFTTEYVNNLDNASENKFFCSGFQALNRPSIHNYATGLTLVSSELKYTYQLAFDTYGNTYVRYKNTTDWQAWKQLAFTDSDITGNAASATKLAKARSFWGNSFDGTGDVTGSIAFNSVQKISWHSNADSYYIRSSVFTEATNPSLEFCAWGGHFFSSQGVTRLIINQAGNVTIGGNDYAGENCKLFVDGVVNVGSYSSLHRDTNSHMWVNYGGSVAEKNLILCGYNTSFYYGKGSNYQSAMFINSSGNVGIGTTLPTQKLDVRGNQYITGYIYADGDLHTGQWLKTSTGVAFGSAHTLTFNSYSIISNAELSFTNITTVDISTGIKAAIKAGLMQINDIIGHRIFLGNNSAGTASNQPFSICTYSSVSNYAPANVTELFRVDPAGEVTIKKDLIVEGNVIAYGQVSSGGVGEEGGTTAGSGLERVVFTIPANTTTFDCVHNLGTREISVAIYEEGNDYQQILTDVYLDSTNIARVVFGSATDVAHKVVIIG